MTALLVPFGLTVYRVPACLVEPLRFVPLITLVLLLPPLDEPIIDRLILFLPE